MSEWISGSKKWPPLNVWVLGKAAKLLNDDGEEVDKEFLIFVVKRTGKNPRNPRSWDANGNICGCCQCGIELTHWMPLPTFPTEEKYE